jgi:hypothetical protein
MLPAGAGKVEGHKTSCWPSPEKSSPKKVAAKSFILQEDAEPLSSAPVWAEPSQLLIGMWLFALWTIWPHSDNHRSSGVIRHQLSRYRDESIQDCSSSGVQSKLSRNREPNCQWRCYLGLTATTSTAPGIVRRRIGFCGVRPASRCQSLISSIDQVPDWLVRAK